MLAWDMQYVRLKSVSAYDNLIEFIHNRLLHVQHLAIISALVEL